jgi:hypothetical protein
VGVQAPSSRENGLAIQRANAGKEIRLNHTVKENRQHQIEGSKFEARSDKNFGYIAKQSYYFSNVPQIF